MQVQILPHIAAHNIRVNSSRNQSLQQRDFRGNSKPFSDSLGLAPAYFYPVFTGNLQAQKCSMLLDSVLDSNAVNKNELLEKLSGAFKTLFESGQLERLNDGRDGVVYKLDNKYVVKVLKHQNPDTNNFKVVNDVFNKKFQTWYGGVVAKTNNISILKNANGDEKAVAYGAPFEMGNFGLVSTINIYEYYQKNSLPKLVTMPQKAFDAVAADFKELNNIVSSNNGHYVFETFNPNNILMLKDKIRLVDGIEKVDYANANDFQFLLDSFIGNMHAFCRSVYDGSMVADRKIIFKKCVMASERAKLPIIVNDRNKYDFSHDLKLVGIKTRPSKFVSNLKQIRHDYPDADQRLAVVEKYIDNLV